MKRSVYIGTRRILRSTPCAARNALGRQRPPRAATDSAFARLLLPRDECPSIDPIAERVLTTRDLPRMFTYSERRRRQPMLWTISIVLLLLWPFGLISGYASPLGDEPTTTRPTAMEAS